MAGEPDVRRFMVVGGVRLRRRDDPRGALLAGHPGGEFRGGKRDHPEAHDRMRVAAILGALPVKIARFIRFEPQVVGPVRNHVHLARELGHPKTVNHVHGPQVDAHRASGGNDEFVAGHQGSDAVDLFPGIFELEPPLVPGRCDLIGIGPLIVRNVKGVPDVLQGWKGDDEQAKHRDADQGDFRQGTTMLVRRRSRVFTGAGPGAELPRRVGQHRAHEEKDHGCDVDRNHEEVELRARRCE